MARKFDAAVLGAGIVGVCVAVHLQMQGRQTVLLDRNEPGSGTSYGNAGLIQDEAIMPYLFPRSVGEISRYARNRSIDAAYDMNALPTLAGPFLRYWHNSRPGGALAIAHARAPLFRRCIADHLELAQSAGALALLKPTGWSKVFATKARLEQAIAGAEAEARDLGVAFEAMDAAALAAHEPDLARQLAGGLHWPGPRSVPDPLALTQAYRELFQLLGGIFLNGDARSLEKAPVGWEVTADIGPVSARDIVLALGPWSPVVTKKLGYAAPFFVKRGYHQHFALRDGFRLAHPILDGDNGYLLVPMHQGIRLTTGAEFAHRDAPPHPVQLARALPKARALFAGLGEALEPEPWLGSRPCLPDMLPVIGPAPGHPGAWFAFGHAHHGLTLGPTTGKIMADMIVGNAPEVDPVPYRAERFHHGA